MGTRLVGINEIELIKERLYCMKNEVTKKLNEGDQKMREYDRIVFIGADYHRWDLHSVCLHVQ